MPFSTITSPTNRFVSIIKKFVYLQQSKKRNIQVGNLGATEIILIVLVLILLFGGKKIPELMKGLGQGVKQFKKGLRGEDDEEKNKDE